MTISWELSSIFHIGKKCLQPSVVENPPALLNITARVMPYLQSTEIQSARRIAMKCGKVLRGFLPSTPNLRVRGTSGASGVHFIKQKLQGAPNSVGADNCF